MKKSWLKRGNKELKRSPLKRGNKRLKKRGKNPRKALLLKADTALQAYYRTAYKGTLCEGCQKPFGVMHHFVLKSHSNRLRYEHSNLIYLCTICHSKVHGFHGELVQADIILKRGKKWLQELRELEREHISLGIIKLRGIIEAYNEKATPHR